MALLKTLKPLLSSAAIAMFVILAMTNKAYSQSESTSFTYDFYGDKPTTLTYQGDAFFPPDSTFLRLTKTASGVSVPGTVGRVLHTAPVLFRREGALASFETSIEFNISSWTSTTQPADGIVFFVAPVGSTIPQYSVGGNLGVYSLYGQAPNVLAIEFDIFVNSPYDPSFPHIGINLGSRTSTNVTRFEGTIGQRVRARINYEAATKVISVRATAGAANYEVSLVYDLSALLPEQVQVGLSGASGLEWEDAAVHDVVSWYFTSTLVNNFVSEEKGTKIAQV
ncbi:mannose/glucose-specific lectin-like [Salvia hispanica]|uniref:mannose/glucose-specific lectin-like n=1 Tax=Salvia hispanica TaxID=49212 RepID=UPI0020095310|nr:mannose/glucose-specific lectin-like [Salvia hispanica]